MADIQTYLRELETRLAPSLDHQSLRERLVEAENHLRDRAQEFEEVGLPSHEAEARAVAAFGEPEEYAEGVPVRPAPHGALTEKARPRGQTGDLALQLAWSAVGLGLVGMLAYGESVWVAGGAAVAFIGLGALFGRPTSTLRMAGLALVASLAAFPILLNLYEPLPYSGSYGKERLGVHLRGVRSPADFDYQRALSDLADFEGARAAFHADGGIVRRHEVGFGGSAGFVGPASRLPDDLDNWPSRYGDYSGRDDGLQEYDTADQAARMWRRNGEAIHRSLAAAVEKAKPIVPQLDEYERLCRFGLVALAGGVALLATMAGVQALALAFRAALAWLFGGLRRRPEPPSRLYGEPESF